MYLGAAGAGARMKLVVNMVMGSMMGAFCEGMALSERAGLKQADLLEVLSLGAMANPMFTMKGENIVNRAYPPAFPLKHQQKDLRLALALGKNLQLQGVEGRIRHGSPSRGLSPHPQRLLALF